MKKLILALVLISVGICDMSFASSAPKHRYQPSATEAEAGKEDVAQADTAQVTGMPVQGEGTEAYSDTTSVTADEAGQDDVDWRTNHSFYSPVRYDSPFDYVGTIFGKGALFALLFFCLLFALLLLFAPFVIVILLIRYLKRRHEDRIKLAEMAMQSGQPISEEKKSIEMQSEEFLVKRGLRNAFLGLGLATMFMLWDASFLAGVGALVFFYGLGQVAIAALPAIKDLYDRWKNK